MKENAKFMIALIVQPIKEEWPSCLKSWFIVLAASPLNICYEHTQYRAHIKCVKHKHSELSWEVVLGSYCTITVKHEFVHYND